MRNAKEKSSCSPSGRTYSHYKTLLEKPSILSTIHRIFSLALDHDIILKRWSQTITTLIPKDEGLIYVHRLRAIHVVEAELQFFSKQIYAKRMINIAERANVITDEQYGGRKGRRAQSVVLNKILYYTISHQTREEAAFLDDDAKACYDRILPSLAGVETRKWGLTHKASSITRNIIEQQQFKVKTAHGVSSTQYQYDESDQTYGVGQGLGWSGAIWMASSNTICEIMKDKCGGMEFSSPDGTITIRKRGDLFVDDTALGVTEGCTKDDMTVNEQLAQDGQQHAFSLFAEGHRLTLPKCSWYSAKYAREGTKHRHLMIHEAPGTLQLREGFDLELKTVRRLEPFNVHKTLGNYISLDGRQTGQLRFLKSKVMEWAKRIRTSGLNGSQRILAYNGYLVPSLAYRLATSSLSFKQCKELQTIIDPILLHAHGLQRNLPKIVLFSTASKAGLGITHLYHLQGQEKLKLFLMHLRRNDTSGNLLRIAMENTQMEIGIGNFFMKEDYYDYNDFITKNWVTHLWQYLSDCNSTVIPTQHANYEMPRESDQYFMTLIYAAKLSTEDKEIINQIRLRMKILTLADIVAIGSNTSILQPIWEATPIRDSKWKWPKILDYPTDWTIIWKRALTDIIQPHLSNNPLGRWQGTSHQKWTYTASENGKYIKTNNCIYERFHTTRRSTFIPTSINTPCPFPADVHHCDDTIQLLSWLSYTVNVSPTIDDDDITPEWMQKNWGVNIPIKTQEKIAMSLESSTLMAVSDGSVNRGRAGQAWTLYDIESDEKLIEGASMVDGESDELSSNRAEMFGLLAGVSCVEVIAKRFAISTGTLLMYTDSMTSIRKSINFSQLSTKDIFKLDNDVAMEIRERIKQAPFKVKIRHVKGHQDREKEYDELDLQAQLNCQMDKLVSTYMNSTPSQTTIYPLLPHQKYAVCIAGEVTPNNIHNKLIDHYNDEAWAEHISKRLGIKHNTICCVDWMPMRKVMSTPKLKGSYVKNFHKELNTMERCKLWRTSDTSKCPLCSKKKETWKHVLQCKNEHVTRVRREEIQKISEELSKLQTHVSIKAFFLHIIDRWTLNKTPKCPHFQNADPIEEKIIKIYEAQKQIGWDAFVKGILCSEWKALQQEDYDGQRVEKRTGEQWSRKMVSKLFEYNHALWKNRCDLVHLENKETLEKRKRTQLRNLRDRLRRKPWKMRSQDRHLLQREDGFFNKGNMLGIDLWEQLVFVAMEQRGKTNESNDIRQYGTIRKPPQPTSVQTSTSQSPTVLQPSQTIGKYRQQQLRTFIKKKAPEPTRTVLSPDLRRKQVEIENYMNRGNNRIRDSTQVKQYHLRDFFVNSNNKPQGHRGMARGPHVGATRKINNLIN